MRRHIARVKPAVDDHGFGRFGLPPVSGHHHVAARDDFADRLAVRINVLPVFIHHANLDADHRVAGARLHAIFLLSGQSRMCGLTFETVRNGEVSVSP